RRNVSRLLRCRSSAIVFSADWDQSEQLSAPTPAAIDELGDPVDKREKIPGEQTAQPIDRSQRRAWVAGAERRSAAGFSRRLLHHDAGNELSFHRQVQAHQITIVKKRLRVLVLFDGVRQTKIDVDFIYEMMK